MALKKIIGISGNSGAGKTTLAEAFAKDLQVTRVGWDDFDDISISPDELVDWYHRGKDYHEFNYKALADILCDLKSEQSVKHPTLGHLLIPTEYIVFDAPLGRFHEQTGKYIDHWVHIKAPLDVSLARRVIRDFKAKDKTKKELLEELEFYLSDSRPLFLDHEWSANADLIVDGMLSIEAQVEEIKRYLKTLYM